MAKVERSGELMEQHITILGVLHIAYGALGILIAMIVFMAVVGGGMLSGDTEAMAITSLVGTSIATFLIVPSLPGLIGGLGIFRYRQWARITLLVVGFINLLIVPFGTILGIYTIWVLMNIEVKDMFEKQAAGRVARGES
ncbi:MAG: hypothetical protein KAU49_06510 [Candidatus Krumholzibacteria bacterium]|nr:hypothetical protein [Candidatus Krumholzibacteria bacterium]